MKHQLLIVFSMSCIFFFFGSAFAETIDLPEDELARESVYPIFDRPDVTRNRNVITASKFELSPYVGFNMSEPIYNQMKYGANIGYHWNESSAVIFNLTKFAGGLNTQYTEALYKQYGLDFNRAPKLNWALYANYEYKAYYGKISLTKRGVMNLTTYPIFGLGMNSYENKMYPGFDTGIGQKFYFTKSFGLRFDMKLQYAQSPSPFLEGRMRDSTAPAGADPKPSLGEFKDKWSFSTILDVGVTFVF